MVTLQLRAYFLFLLHQTEHTVRTMAAMTNAMTIASTTATTTPATRPALASPSPRRLLVGAMDADITVLVVRGLFTSRHTSLSAIPPDVDNIEAVVATLVDTTGLLEVGSEAGWLVVLGEGDAGA